MRGTYTLQNLLQKRAEKHMRTDYELKKATPESQGVSSRALLKLIREMDDSVNEVHGFVLERNGYLLTESYLRPYGRDIPHTCHSLGKSYTCTAIGIACKEGLMSVDDLLTDLLKDEFVYYGIEPSGMMKKVRVRDLMCMGTGMASMAELNEHWLENFLRYPVTYERSQNFYYNTTGSCVLGYLVEKVTGMSLENYLRKKLLCNIGVEDREIVFLTFGDGCTAEPGISATTRANLRLGMFYLNEGFAGGRQIVDESWIREAVKPQNQDRNARFDPNTEGYGWQLWINKKPGQFRFDGGQGQMMIADREKNAVCAFHQAGRDPMGCTNQTRLVSEFLNSLSDTALPEDPDALAELEAYMAGRTLPDGKVLPLPEGALKHAGEYVMDEGNANFWIEVIPVDDNFYRQFYDPSVRVDMKYLNIRFEEDAVMLTVNRKTEFKLRLDGKQEAFESSGGVLPLLPWTCSTCCFTDENTMEFTVRCLNGWVVSKGTICFDGANITVQMSKDMLHEGRPPVERASKGRRVR